MEDKNERKNLKPVVSGTVKTKKKSEARKLADTFIAEDASKVKDYLLGDVLIPAIKKTIQDIVTNGIDMLLNGGDSARRSSNIPATKVSFRDYSGISRNNRQHVTNRSTYSYDELVLSTRGEAEAVLQQMDETLSQYQFVTVADLYDLVGITGSYTDNKWGWTDLRSAQAVRVRDGYLLKLPRAIPID